MSAFYYTHRIAFVDHSEQYFSAFSSLVSVATPSALQAATHGKKSRGCGKQCVCNFFPLLPNVVTQKPISPIELQLIPEDLHRTFKYGAVQCPHRQLLEHGLPSFQRCVQKYQPQHQCPRKFTRVMVLTAQTAERFAVYWGFKNTLAV